MFHAVRVALQRLSTLTVASVVTLSSLATAAPLFFSQAATAASLGDVLINEIMANPAAGSEWVELYNTTSSSIDIGQWQIRDNGNFHNVPENVTIAAHGFYVGEKTAGNGLSNSGETVTLEGHANAVIDTYVYGNAISGQSFARDTDGSGNWVSRSGTDVTKSLSNNLSPIVVIPGVPTLVSPAASANLTTAPTIFTWTVADAAISYEIEFSTSSTFGAGAGFTSGATSLTTAEAVPVDGTYYWRVRGVSSTGHTGAWATGTFTVNAPVNQAPSVPVLASPANGVVRHSSDDNYSTWAASTDPDGDDVTYVYQSSFVSDFSSVAFEGSTGSDTQIQNGGSNGLEPEGTYYWHVKAVDEHGLASGWSETRSIVIDNTAPDNFGLLSPEDNAVLTSSSFEKFDWEDTADTNAVSYSILLYKDGDWMPSAGDLTTSEWTPASPLEEGSYGWSVWATDAAGNETWTEGRSFVIDNTVPTPEDDNGRGGEEEEESTPPIEEPVSPPVITAVLAVAQLITGANDGSRVLASSSNASNSDIESDSEVKAAETTSEDNTVDGAVEEDEQKLIEDAGGMLDYWWIALLALLGLFWFVAAKRRKSDEE